jgi:hypothetical protein
MAILVAAFTLQYMNYTVFTVQCNSTEHTLPVFSALSNAMLATWHSWGVIMCLLLPKVATESHAVPTGKFDIKKGSPTTTTTTTTKQNVDPARRYTPFSRVKKSIKLNVAKFSWVCRVCIYTIYLNALAFHFNIPNIAKV